MMSQSSVVVYPFFTGDAVIVVTGALWNQHRVPGPCFIYLLDTKTNTWYERRGVPPQAGVQGVHGGQQQPGAASGMGNVSILIVTAPTTAVIGIITTSTERSEAKG